MYDELIIKLREIEAMCETVSFEEAANDLKEAADAIESLAAFANWVAKNIMSDGDWWVVFPEFACRRLHKLGIIGDEDGKWVYEWEYNRRKELL